MMNDTAEADDAGDWLRKKYPSEFGGERLLIIHKDRSGDVSKKDLDIARKVSREVDDEKSPTNCIVSVLMCCAKAGTCKVSRSSSASGLAHKQLQPTQFEDLFVLEQKKLL